MTGGTNKGAEKDDDDEGVDGIRKEDD